MSSICREDISHRDKRRGLYSLQSLACRAPLRLGFLSTGKQAFDLAICCIIHIFRVCSGTSLPLKSFEFFLDLFATDLCVAHGGLDGGRPFLGGMSEVIGDLFDRPPGIPRPVGKVVAEVVEGDVGDQVPLVFGSLPLHCSEPMVNTELRETQGPLGGERVRAT